ncbi:cyclase [Micromonospora rosaria]|uniref:Cyclase n=1 Tax=Micromonospora rosaria TaxID=47874 RepID=A0A0P0ISD8_9ACTN|nr:aromatase/cyclase [Micromonospora rosaria]ALJ99851.1 FlsD [Micromonospora rosaria]KXK58781.1 cyclase [Micromonospora rosaria]
MSDAGTRTVEHDIEIDAPADEVYRLIAEVVNWPQIFPPTIYVDQLEAGEGTERIRIWATANGTAKNWTSRRVLDPVARRIEFRQEVSAPPVASMSGTWLLEPAGEGRTRVRLLHEYRAVDDDPEGLAWIDQAVDRNSRSELAALKTNVELATAAAEATLSFEDTVQINGPRKEAYDFINEAHLWDQRLPHVARVTLTEDTPGLQDLEMETRAKDGSTHLTRSYRVTLPPSLIAYKQVTLPKLMSLHTGRWSFEENADGVAVTSQHTIVVNTANIAAVLGPDATVVQARDYVRDALSTNSRATLGYAKEHVEKNAGS